MAAVSEHAQDKIHLIWIGLNDRFWPILLKKSALVSLAKK
jgi:hypothetical protein